MVQNKTPEISRFGLAVWSQVMNTPVTGNWKVAPVECVAPQNNLLETKLSLLLTAVRKNTSVTKALKRIMISQGKTGGYNEMEVMVDGSSVIANV